MSVGALFFILAMLFLLYFVSGLHLTPRQAHGRLDLVDGTVVSGERARLREAFAAEVAREGAHVAVAPVVDDQARALLEDLVAAAVLADEVGLHAVVVRIEHLKALVATDRDCF
eukprot:CAMPEP_0170458470 /NCGR_PEP_ID=MMETSP0123-20130129/5431_1 /TAXON_ID=182087 /ORGANISM="Favella ehrenbergii, Strain Fehren 1" /LENGTH=113 /DNA_ID=CAMNT_0010722633 /DNA_START=50 /DNA_END=391 /DNA_ORIENTATION=-